ncbi:MAG: hypothetical protein C0490_18220 [Marivirga sp.]|nr:hypothetical protein [Marivirga sp.]
MNFGNWIVVAFILFAVFIGTLVTVCVREDVDLVSKDYYQQELQYQDQIQRLNNTSRLLEKPEVKIVNQRLQVVFSKWDDIDNGEIKLFCPSNPKMDRNFPLVRSSERVQSFTVESLQKGMYRAKLMWKVDGNEFYMEEVVYI